MSLLGQAGRSSDLRGSKYSLYQHTCDDEDSQGHDGDHHQGGDGLLLLTGGHHGQEICVFTACTDVPRMAAGKKGMSVCSQNKVFSSVHRGPGHGESEPVQPLLRQTTL